MLIRIVRMTFEESKVEDFLNLFNKSKHEIRRFKGCLHLELMQDYHQTNIFTTYSHWIDEHSLEVYRTSPLFKEVWEQTKKLFKEKPVAFSLKAYIRVEEPEDFLTSEH